MSRISQSRGWPRAVPAVALALGLTGFVAAWGWATAPLRLAPPMTAGPRSSADAIARRAEVAFADAEAETARAARGAGRADLVFFRGATASACASGVGGRGAFYCPETGVAAVDLGYLETLAARLKDRADLGVALVAARLAAEHRQRETGVLDAAALDMIGARKARRADIGLGLALQADCLTGAWAGTAEARLGPVPEGFWGTLVGTVRNVGADFAAAGQPIPPELDGFATGSREARAAAFARGYAAAAAGAPAAGACPTPIRLEVR